MALAIGGLATVFWQVGRALRGAHKYPGAVPSFAPLWRWRYFGWRSQAIALLVFGPYQAGRERLWFEVFMPVLAFQPGVIPFLGSVGMLIAGTASVLYVMRLIGGPDNPLDRNERHKWAPAA